MASTGLLSDYITPATVAACSAAETAPTPRYTDAAAMIPARSGGSMLDASDVAALARVLLASVAASDPSASAERLANVAVWRARQALSAMDVRQRGNGSEYAAGDTFGVLADDDDSDARTSIPRSGWAAPDACARWTMSDTVAVAVDCAADPDAAIIVDTLRRDGSVSAVARALGLPTGGRSAGRVSERIGAVLADLAASAANVTAWVAPESAGPDRARALARDSYVPTSGTASACIVTRPNGERWAVLSTVAHRVSADAVAVVLATVDTLPPYVGGTRREIDAAALEDAWHRGMASTARRPNGVPAGARYGTKVAGEGAPEPRPTMSRKRKRDGGIGSPMSPC